MTDSERGNDHSRSGRDHTPRPRLPKRLRVRKRSEFLAVRAARAQVRDGVLRVGFARRDDDGPARLGLAVGRRAGNAVVRNRIKRVIRAAWREQPDLFPAGLDLVVVPTNPRRAARYGDVARSLRHLAARITDRRRGGGRSREARPR